MLIYFCTRQLSQTKRIVAMMLRYSHWSFADRLHLICTHEMGRQMLFGLDLWPRIALGDSWREIPIGKSNQNRFRRAAVQEITVFLERFSIKNYLVLGSTIVGVREFFVCRLQACRVVAGRPQRSKKENCILVADSLFSLVLLRCTSSSISIPSSVQRILDYSTDNSLAGKWDELKGNPKMIMFPACRSMHMI